MAWKRSSVRSRLAPPITLPPASSRSSAIATGRAERDPAADLRGALPPVNGGHFASITDPAGIGALLRAIDGYEGTLVARCALRFAPLVFVRPGELRQAE